MSRTETDSLGPIDVPDEAYWGAQTQRSLINFAIGQERMPLPVVHALALIKKAAARVNQRIGELPADLARLIEQAANEVLAGQHDEQFPLVVWQTGSGTQSNMNVNEVIAGRANELAGNGRGGKTPVHPNDHVNRAQSSNDSFPTAMHIAAVQAVQQQLLPALRELRDGLQEQAERHARLVKTGRTHMMDATPMTFGQELSAFVAQLGYAERAIQAALPAVCELAQGGTAVGTGLNSPQGFADAMAAELAPLKLESARFQTLVEELPEAQWGPWGMDRVEFLISTNPGAPFAPLTKIASGGELSRFILALKVALAEQGGRFWLYNTPLNYSCVRLLADAIERANQADILFVAAAGNNGGALKRPADCERVMAVVAVFRD